MQALDTYKRILKHHKHPFFVVDGQNHQVLACNNEMKKLLLGKKEAVGRPFYQVIQDKDQEDDAAQNLNWQDNGVIRRRIYDQDLGTSFDVTLSRLEEGQQNLIFLEYVMLDAENEKPIHFDLAKRITLLEMNKEGKINALLHLLGEAYRADCTYVHLVDHQEKTIKLYSHWLKSTITDTTHYLVQDVEDIAGFEGLILWASCRDAQGLWDCDMEREQSPQQVLDKIALSVFGRNNLIGCGIEDGEGKLIAAISIGDCETLQVSHSLLKYVTELIQSILFS